MDDNRITGAARNIEGKIEDAVGALSGDVATQLRGKIDQGVAEFQAAIGKAKEAGATMADAAATFVKQASNTGAKAASALQDAAKKASTDATEIGERVYGDARRASQSLARTVEEQPLAALLVAAAIGYGIAYLVHRRRAD
jgi:uncharacterized protein YjbJ (UPF0337 family)